jgi:hypothetical protein
LLSITRVDAVAEALPTPAALHPARR